MAQIMRRTITKEFAQKQSPTKVEKAAREIAERTKIQSKAALSCPNLQFHFFRATQPNSRCRGSRRLTLQKQSIPVKGRHNSKSSTVWRKEQLIEQGLSDLEKTSSDSAKLLSMQSVPRGDRAYLGYIRKKQIIIYKGPRHVQGWHQLNIYKGPRHVQGWQQWQCIIDSVQWVFWFGLAVSSAVDQLVEQFQDVDDFVPGVFEAVEAELGESVLEAAVGFDLHLDPVEGNQLGGLGQRLEVGLFYLLLDFLDFLLLLERRGRQLLRWLYRLRELAGFASLRKLTGFSRLCELAGFARLRKVGGFVILKRGVLFDLLHDVDKLLLGVDPALVLAVVELAEPGCDLIEAIDGQVVLHRPHPTSAICLVNMPCWWQWSFLANISSVYSRIVAAFTWSDGSTWHTALTPLIFFDVYFISAYSSPFSDASFAYSQIGFITLMQYLQKQQANMGLELAKSSPVFLKGLCLLMISIGSDIIAKLAESGMLGLIGELLARWFGWPTYNICLLGIEQTGKTTLFNAIKSSQEPSPTGQGSSKGYRPTVGMNFARYAAANDKFMIWDLGGKPHIRKIWESYYSECHGLIYLVDKKVEEGLSALKNVLTHQQMVKIPLIVLVTGEADKQAVEGRLRHADWVGDRKYVVHQMAVQNAARSKALIGDLLHWLYFNIRQLHLTLRD